MKILLINGPNLNLLGSREPDVYGQKSLSDLVSMVVTRANEAAVEIEHLQSNHEGTIIDRIQETEADGILINPGGLTHTSVSLRDCLAGVGIPFVEVHISNIHAREPFRKISYLSDIAVGTVSGFGLESYLLGFDGLLDHLNSK